MRYIWLVPLLIMASGAKAAEPVRDVTTGEIYRQRESGAQLTDEQRTYIKAVISTASKMNFVSRDVYGRGLYCLPRKQWHSEEFIVSVLSSELLHPVRGWVYSTDEPASKIIVDGLRFQYPCTDEEESRIKKESRELWRRAGDHISTGD